MRQCRMAALWDGSGCGFRSLGCGGGKRPAFLAEGVVRDLGDVFDATAASADMALLFGRRSEKVLHEARDACLTMTGNR